MGFDSLRLLRNLSFSSKLSSTLASGTLTTSFLSFLHGLWWCHFPHPWEWPFVCFPCLLRIGLACQSHWASQRARFRFPRFSLFLSVSLTSTPVLIISILSLALTSTCSFPPRFSRRQLRPLTQGLFFRYRCFPSKHCTALAAGLSVMCCIFFFIQFKIFSFPFWLLLWPSGYWEACFIVFLGSFLLLISSLILLWSDNIPCMTWIL